MMTQIEMDEARASIRANHAIADKLSDIDWEQRRYEIAKEMLPVLFESLNNVLRSGQNPKNPYQLVVSGAVKWADDLIEELKK